MSRDGHEMPTWGHGNTASRDVRSREQSLECAVTRVVGGMPFLWLAIEDEAGPDSLRGLIERNSGLWNSNHVDEDDDPAFLDVLEGLVSAARRSP